MMCISDLVCDLITLRSIVGAMVLPLGHSLHTTRPSSICGNIRITREYQDYTGIQEFGNWLGTCHWWVDEIWIVSREISFRRYFILHNVISLYRNVRNNKLTYGCYVIKWNVRSELLVTSRLVVYRPWNSIIISAHPAERPTVIEHQPSTARS